MKDLWIVLLLLLFAACQQNTNHELSQEDKSADSTNAEPHEVLNVDFTTCINDRADIWLSDLAESIDYIPLETGDEFLIGEKGLKIRFANGYIFVGQDDMPVLMFDDQGHFIRRIGTIGRGPTEFNPDYLFFVEPGTRKLVFANAFRSSLIEYSWEGHFIREIKPVVQPMHFYPLPDNSYLIWSFRQQEDSAGFFRWSVCNENGALLKALYEPKREFSLAGGILSPLVYWGNNRLLINTWENESLNTLTKDYSFTTALSWHLGALKMPYSAASDYSRYKTEKHKYLRDVMAYETPTSWLLSCHYQKSMLYGVINRSNGEIVFASNPAPEGEGIINDVDGGPPFWPAMNIVGAGSYYQAIPAIELKIWFADSSRAQASIVNSEAGEQLKELVHSLKEADNPVIRRVKIK